MIDEDDDPAATDRAISAWVAACCIIGAFAVALAAAIAKGCA